MKWVQILCDTVTDLWPLGKGPEPEAKITADIFTIILLYKHNFQLFIGSGIAATTSSLYTCYEGLVTLCTRYHSRLSAYLHQ